MHFYFLLLNQGEAQYINDIPAALDELFGVFVVSDVGSATIKSIDASKALVLIFVEFGCFVRNLAIFDS